MSDRSTLAGVLVKKMFGMFGVPVADKPVALVGQDANFSAVPLLVASDGTLATSGTASGNLTDRSGTIASGGTAQDAAAANTARKFLLLQNNSDTDMWFNLGTTAVASEPSIKLIAGAAYQNPPHFCPTGRVSVIGATTGKTFTCKEA